MADDKISLDGIKESLSSMKDGSNNQGGGGNKSVGGGNNFKGYNHNGSLADEVSNGKEKLENGINKVTDIAKSLGDLANKGAGSKGSKGKGSGGNKGSKSSSGGGGKSQGALGGIKDSLGGSNNSSNNSGDSNSNNGGDKSTAEEVMQKMEEQAKQTANEAKLAIKLAAKIASQNYVGAALDALKDPKALFGIVKKIFLIVFALILIVVGIVLIPFFMIACLFFWLLPGATTNSASKEHGDIAVKDMSNGEKDVLGEEELTEEDLDANMTYTIEEQYVQMYNIIYDECEKIFDTKEDEFKKEIEKVKKDYNKYEQKKAENTAKYGSKINEIYYENVEGSDKALYKIYSSKESSWLELDNFGLTPDMDSFDEDKSLSSFYDYADLDIIADDIAYIMACYTVSKGDCAPIHEGDAEPTSTTGYIDEFRDAVTHADVTANLFKLTSTTLNYNDKRTVDTLNLSSQTLTAFLTPEEIEKSKSGSGTKLASGYDDMSKYPKDVYFINLKEYNDNNVSLKGEVDTYSNSTAGSRGSEYNGGEGSYNLVFGANLNLNSDDYSFKLGTIDDFDVNYETAFYLGKENKKTESGDSYATFFTNELKDVRYGKIQYSSNSFKNFFNKNKELNKRGIIADYTVAANNNKSDTKNYTISNSCILVDSYAKETSNNNKYYIASPIIVRDIEVTLSEFDTLFPAENTLGTYQGAPVKFVSSGDTRLFADYDNDKEKTGDYNVYLMFESILGSRTAWRSKFNKSKKIKITIGQEMSKFSGLALSEKESKGIDVYRYMVKYSSIKIPSITKKNFTYTEYYVSAIVESFDRSLIISKMFLESDIYKKRIYEKDEDKKVEYAIDIKKGEDDVETLINILNADWYPYHEMFIYSCKDDCSGCHVKNGDKWEQIDNTAEGATPGSGQISKDSKNCVGAENVCPKCSADKQKFVNFSLFGLEINFGAVRKVKVADKNPETQKVLVVDKATGEKSYEKKNITVAEKIKWFTDNILEHVENAKSLRTVAANSTSDIAIVAEALLFQGSIGGQNVHTGLGVRYSNDDYRIWNAAFISYCAKKCDISTAIIPKTFSIEDFKNIETAKVKYSEDVSLDKLKTGDIVYIYDSSVLKYTKAKYPSIQKEQASSEAYGIGLVVSVDKTNNKVNVIEGCAIDGDVVFKQYHANGVKDPESPSGKAFLMTGGIVALKQYNLSNITGYTRPAYEDPKGDVQVTVKLISENIGSSVSIDYVGFNNSGQLVVGYYKWTGNDAFKLLKRIHSMDPNKFYNLLKDNGLENSYFYTLVKSNDDPAARNGFGAGLGDHQKAPIKKVIKELLQSPAGLVASESQKLYDVAKYIEKVRGSYQDVATICLLSDLMFAKQNPLMLEIDEWAKNYKDYFNDNFDAAKGNSLDVAKKYFVTNAKENNVPNDISQRAKKSIEYLSTLPPEQLVNE